MKSKLLRVTLLLCGLFAPSTVALGQQCTDPEDFSEWINCKVNQIAQAQINRRGNTQQTESPSIGGNTTSLVDQSSAPDLIGTALNLAGLTSKSNEKNTTSYSFTASAYSLYAMAMKHDPLDPAFYTQNRNWRHFSITLGQEFPDQAGASGNQRATLV